jgi:hypothetical protein
MLEEADSAESTRIGRVLSGVKHLDSVLDKFSLRMSLAICEFMLTQEHLRSYQEVDRTADINSRRMKFHLLKIDD